MRALRNIFVFLLDEASMFALICTLDSLNFISECPSWLKKVNTLLLEECNFRYSWWWWILMFPLHRWQFSNGIKLWYQVTTRQKSYCQVGWLYPEKQRQAHSCKNIWSSDEKLLPIASKLSSLTVFGHETIDISYTHIHSFLNCSDWNSTIASNYTDLCWCNRHCIWLQRILRSLFSILTFVNSQYTKLYDQIWTDFGQQFKKYLVK